MKNINSIKDIARELGISPATVSLALNDSNLISDETKIRVKNFARDVGYVPNLAARNLVRKKSKSIGLVIPDIENVFYASLVKCLNDEVNKAGYKLIVSISNNVPEIEEKIIITMVENRVEGMIIVPMSIQSFDNEYIRMLDNHSIPYIFCADYYKGFPDISVVMCDLESGMYDITKKVIEAGYKKMAYLSGSPYVESLYKRQLGFERAAAGNEYDIYELEKIDYKSACAATYEILEKKPDTDVFVCVNDMAAIGVANVLSKMGYSIPEEKGVAGFDNSIFSEVAFTGISTVIQDIEQIAVETVKALLNKEQKQLFIPTKIVMRNSLKK